MTQYIAAYLLTGLVYLAIDAVWLGWIARKFYFTRLGHLLLDKPNLGSAAAFYLVYMAGVVVFAIAPGLAAASPLVALGYGGLFGLCAYATYDVTNYATLRDWPFAVSAVDTVWGAVLTGSSAAIGCWLTLAFFA